MRRWNILAIAVLLSSCSSAKHSGEGTAKTSTAPAVKESPGIDSTATDNAPLKLTPREITLSNGKQFTLKVPEEFDIKVAADGFKRVRFMAESPDHRIFVTDMYNLADNSKGVIYILGELDKETGSFGAPVTYLTDLRNPNSIAFHTEPSGAKWLYVALTDRLVRYAYKDGDNSPSSLPQTLATFPDNGLSYKYGGWHLTRTVAIGPGNKVYVSVGSSCNVCEEKEEIRGTITEMDLDGHNPKIIARGLRNAVGLKFADGNLYATNMGVDHLGDDRPEETMYKIGIGADYGWPWCYEYQSKVYFDDKLGPQAGHPDCTKTPLAYASFGAHSSPLGLEYFDSTAAMPVLKDYFLVALHGSSKRSLNQGYRISRVKNGHQPEDFIIGFQEGDALNGRPADILKVGADAFLFTDDNAGVVYFVYRRTSPSFVIAVNCKEPRLTGAQRETCASTELMRLSEDIDKMTFSLEQALTGADKEALLDTGGPFVVERNNCQNARPAVRECVERVLGERRDGLTAALTSPAAIRGEIVKYTFLSPRYFEKYGNQLVGRHVHVFGCMVLDGGPSAAVRLRGFVSDGCSKTGEPFVPVIFDSMNETTATFFDSKMPSTHWEGAVERRDGRLVLSIMTAP
jgi:glucose/arabinose dehydrogenase